eukprot:12724778-Ditylum_brightwellii.AAC.1
MVNSLYLSTPWKLCYLIPIANQDDISNKAFALLKEKKLTATQATKIRREIIQGSKEEDNEFLKKYFDEKMDIAAVAEVEVEKVTKNTEKKKDTLKDQSGNNNNKPTF